MISKASAADNANIALMNKSSISRRSVRISNKFSWENVKINVYFLKTNIFSIFCFHISSLQLIDTHIFQSSLENLVIGIDVRTTYANNQHIFYCIQRKKKMLFFTKFLYIWDMNDWVSDKIRFITWGSFGSKQQINKREKKHFDFILKLEIETKWNGYPMVNITGKSTKNFVLDYLSRIFWSIKL